MIAGSHAVPRPTGEHRPVCGHHSVRDAVRLQGNDGGRAHDGTGYHHDLHLLRLLRYVQRTLVSV